MMDPEQREAAESEQEFDNLMESDEYNPYGYGDRETTFGLVRKKIIIRNRTSVCNYWSSYRQAVLPGTFAP